MDLNDVRDAMEKSRKMLKLFIDAVYGEEKVTCESKEGEKSYDILEKSFGEWYSTFNEIPFEWGEGFSKYRNINDLEAEGYFIDKDYDEETLKNIKEKGLIFISKAFKQQKQPDENLYVTLLHETLHGNRNVLAYDRFRNGKNEKAYNNERHYSKKREYSRIESNTDFFDNIDVDPSQDILKSDVIGTGSSNENEYNEEDVQTRGEVNERIARQIKIDEALIEIMARSSYFLYKNKEKGDNKDIWEVLKDVRKLCLEEFLDLKEMDKDIGEMRYDTIGAKNRVIMCDIIVKHHDFELFNWMIEPIEYSLGDMHYDFFNQYTKNDKELLDKLYYDEFDIEMEKLEQVTKEDIGESARKEEAIKNMPPTLQMFMKNIQEKYNKDDNNLDNK